MSELVNLSETTVLKRGNVFCIALRDGSLPLAGDHPLGVYHDDCRYLRGRELRVGGVPPRLLAASDAAGTAAVFELTNPGLRLADSRELPPQSLRLRVERHVLSAGMIERITVRSYAREPIELPLELRVDADFRPMLEVRGIVEPADREVHRGVQPSTLTFATTGRDQRVRSTTVSCAGARATDGGGLGAVVRLGPGDERTFEVFYQFAEQPDEPTGGERLGREAATARAAPDVDAWPADRPWVEVDDEVVDRMLRRSLLDLRLLASDLGGQRYYAAGVPWYATLFGRDSVITALEVLTFDPELAAETLRLLAERLGSRVDDEHDEEPGKVLHELRVGEVATAALTPLARYYGTVDATPLFLCLLAEHADWTGSLELFHELREPVEAALRWIDEFADLDGDGLVEYRCRSSGGLVSQGWKDSWDGIIDESGVPLTAPIALVEVQGYVVRAKRRLARLFELDGDLPRARELRDSPATVAAALERFWLPDRGFYAMALDGAKRPSRVLASNQGHLLWALAVPQRRAAAIGDALMSDGAFSGWGVRTLSADERAYNPIGYHTGTVWPHDNALIAAGLRKYGFDEAFLRIFEGLLDAAVTFNGGRLPELFAGFSRTDCESPVPYPVACSPQAWAAGALPSMLTTGLGLMPDGLNRRLRIRRPSLPRQVDRINVRGLRIADARVDLQFQRVAPGLPAVALTDVRIDGDVDVVLEIAPDRNPDLPSSMRNLGG